MNRFSNKFHRRETSDDDRVLPLINVVFLLLIFFLLAGRMTAPDPLNVAPPTSNSDTAVKANEVTLLIDDDRQIAFGGELMDLEQMRAHAAELLAEDENLRVNVRADGTAEATFVVGVLEELRAAGVEMVWLLTLPEER